MKDLKDFVCLTSECECNRSCEDCSECDNEIDKWLDGHDKAIRAEERAKTIEEVKKLIKIRLIDNLSLDNATKYGNENVKQQANSYATIMKYEVADCVEDLIDDLEQLKGGAE